MSVTKSLKVLELCTNPEILLVKVKETAAFFKYIFYLSHQKHVIRIIYEEDRFGHTKSLFKHAKALTVYEINLFQILFLICNCKNRTAPFVFHNLYTLKPPTNYPSEQAIFSLYLQKEQSLANFLYILVVLYICGTKF